MEDSIRSWIMDDNPMAVEDKTVLYMPVLTFPNACPKRKIYESGGKMNKCLRRNRGTKVGTYLPVMT